MRTLLLLIVCNWASFALAQTITLNTLSKADRLYDEFSYLEAIDFYKQAMEKSDQQQYIITKIADSYRLLNLADSSEIWYKQVVDFSNYDPIVNFRLGEALMVNQKYEEAKFWLEKYQSVAPDDERVNRKLDAITNLDQFDFKSKQILIDTLGFNTNALEFSPAYYKDGIVFVSSRSNKKWIEQEYNWDNSTYLDLYQADLEGLSAYILEK